MTKIYRFPHWQNTESMLVYRYMCDCSKSCFTINTDNKYKIFTTSYEYNSEEDIDNIENIPCVHIKMGIHITSLMYIDKLHNDKLHNDKLHNNNITNTHNPDWVPLKCFNKKEIEDFKLLEKKFKNIKK